MEEDFSYPPPPLEKTNFKVKKHPSKYEGGIPPSKPFEVLCPNSKTLFTSVTF